MEKYCFVRVTKVLQLFFKCPRICVLWSRVAHLCSRGFPFCPLCGNRTEFRKFIHLWGKEAPILKYSVQALVEFDS